MTRRWLQLLGGLLSLALLAAAGPAAAEDGDSIRPQFPPEAMRGDACVRDVEDMRRFHMDYLTHKRDQVVHEGIRTPDFTLEQCMECHAAPTETSERPTLRAFCDECHEFAAVQFDCWGCHNPQIPEPGRDSDGQMGALQGETLRAHMQSYVEGETAR